MDAIPASIFFFVVYFVVIANPFSIVLTLSLRLRGTKQEAIQGIEND